jgi:hypothetical protein
MAAMADGATAERKGAGGMPDNPLDVLLEGIETAELELWFEQTLAELARVLEGVAAHVDPLLAGAFLLGALAMVSGARLAIIGAAILVGIESVTAIDLVVEIPRWLESLALALLIAGALQGGITLLFGEQTAGNVVTAALVAIPVFLFWRGPGRLFRLASMLFSLPRRR